MLCTRPRRPCALLPAGSNRSISIFGNTLEVTFFFFIYLHHCLTIFHSKPESRILPVPYRLDNFRSSLCRVVESETLGRRRLTLS
jgi:hypothetical protein